MAAKILNLNGRPCVITGTSRRQHKKKAWGSYVVTNVRYLDGLEPKTASVARGEVEKAKPVRETEALIWERVDELVTTEKMPAARAAEQAKAELAKGVLRPF